MLDPGDGVHAFTARPKVPGRPRKLKRLSPGWQPAEALTVTNVNEVFVSGVCQGRKNLFHGEKSEHHRRPAK
jgi:hypothetical protein